ncbi:MAG: hypothetical protein KME32_08410 [Mojavia pulchra JT2-VF2]|uniref:Uncharacterized protein n=1 Tax=Mojavia pulchra JT2-VF2 TaxID=287848 RepID=A0A951PY60_9NOST|nr:hypothetical protein [Mojavia pulchra JT2-VF2]
MHLCSEVHTTSSNWDIKKRDRKQTLLKSRQQSYFAIASFITQLNS